MRAVKRGISEELLLIFNKKIKSMRIISKSKKKAVFMIYHVDLSKDEKKIIKERMNDVPVDFESLSKN